MTQKGEAMTREEMLQRAVKAYQEDMAKAQQAYGIELRRIWANYERLVNAADAVHEPSVLVLGPVGPEVAVDALRAEQERDAARRCGNGEDADQT